MDIENVVSFSVTCCSGCVFNSKSDISSCDVWKKNPLQSNKLLAFYLHANRFAVHAILRVLKGKLWRHVGNGLYILYSTVVVYGILQLSWAISH